MPLGDYLPWRFQTFLKFRPKKVINNLLDYYKTHSQPNLNEEFLTVIHKGYDKKLKLPNFTNPRSLNHKNYLENPILGINDIQFGAIKNARVFQKNFHVEIITSENEMFNTHTNDLKRKIKKHQLLSEQNVGKAKKLKGKCFLLASSGAHNGYYHWLMDSLTKLYALKKHNISVNSFDHIIATGPRAKYKVDTLKIFNIPEHKVHFTDESEHLQTEYLAFVDTVRYHKEGTDFLKRSFSIKEDINPENLIFISRENAGFRKILNQDKLEEFLTQYNFKTVILEKLSVSDQAKVMAESKFIIAPHGAGLANLAFCSPKTTLFELKPDIYANINFWFHSNCLNLNYYSYIAQSSQNGNQTRPNTYDIKFEDDLFVQLKEIFEKNNISKK
jgi:capsular polysaccharide biosynthesis protein